MKLLSRVILLTTLLYGVSGNAGGVIRQANARVNVTKITMKKINGSYEKSMVEICDKKVAFPVIDMSVNGKPAPEIDINCESTVNQHPVVIGIRPVIYIGTSDMAGVPSKDPVAPVKMIWVQSGVWFKNSNPGAKPLQENDSRSLYTKDMNLEGIGFEFYPRNNETLSTCFSEADCKKKLTVTHEEYFTMHVYIEDKNK